jgi:hypothetical protein
MIQLNLLPDLKKDFIKSQKNKGLVISVSILTTLVALGLSGLFFVYVTFAQQIQIDLMTQDVQKKAKELSEVENVDKYLTIQNQLSSIEMLHNSKGVYSRLFDFFNVLNPSAPNNVTLVGAQLITADKSIVFNGTTASFESLNVFVDTLKNAQVTYQTADSTEPIEELMFDQVFVQNSGLGSGSNKQLVAFTVRAVYRDAVFNAVNTGMKAEIPTIITTPSATEAPIPQKSSQSQQPLFNAEESQ